MAQRQQPYPRSDIYSFSINSLMSLVLNVGSNDRFREEIIRVFNLPKCISDFTLVELSNCEEWELMCIALYITYYNIITNSDFSDAIADRFDNGEIVFNFNLNIDSIKDFTDRYPLCDNDGHRITHYFNDNGDNIDQYVDNPFIENKPDTVNFLQIRNINDILDNIPLYDKMIEMYENKDMDALVNLLVVDANFSAVTEYYND